MHANQLLDSAKTGHIEPSDWSAAKKTDDDGYQVEGSPSWITSGPILGAQLLLKRGSAKAEGPRDALVSRNSATTKYPYRMELFAWSYV